jgi:hypothetical protein
MLTKRSISHSSYQTYLCHIFLFVAMCMHTVFVNKYLYKLWTVHVQVRICFWLPAFSSPPERLPCPSVTFPVDSIIHTCDVLTPSQQIGLNDIESVCVSLGAEYCLIFSAEVLDGDGFSTVVSLCSNLHKCFHPHSHFHLLYSAWVERFSLNN